MSAVLIALLAATMVVPVRLTGHATESARCGGIVSLQSESGATVSAASLDETDRATLELAPSNERSVVVLSSEKCWAASTLIDSSSAISGIELKTWPKGSLTGKFAMSPRDGLPAAVQVDVWPATARTPFQGEPLATLSCTVVDRQWTCDSPATALDVRVAANGYAPGYLLGVTFEKGGAHIPRISLERGASLIGWVEDGIGEAVAGANVYLVPRHLNRAAARAAGVEARTLKASSDQRGFFQIRGISAGEYTVSARTDARATAPAHDVLIERANEYRLPSPLILVPPATVLVQIEPPMTPDGHPWEVQLLRVLTADSALEIAASGLASQFGSWSADGVERGPYSVAVLDTTRSVVARVDTDLDRESGVVDIKVGNIRVEGRIRVGSEPIAAHLKFNAASATVRMESDEKGFFEGWLPREGAWALQITPMEGLQRVRTRTEFRVPPDETAATLNIDLPAGRIEGVVVDENGKAVSETEVLVLSGSDILANAGTDTEGRFQIFGLTPGPVILQAKKRDLASEYYRCTVSPTTPTKQTLVLRASSRLKGQVVDISGAPVVGALIRYFNHDELASAVSGPAGEFSLIIAPGVRRTDVIVIAPRKPVVIEQMDVSAAKPVLVVPETSAVLRIGASPDGILPHIARTGMRPLPISLLFAPRQGFGPPVEAAQGIFELRLAPSEYTVCYSGRSCIPIVADASSVIRVAPPKSRGGT